MLLSSPRQWQGAVEYESAWALIEVRLIRCRHATSAV